MAGFVRVKTTAARFSKEAPEILSVPMVRCGCCWSMSEGRIEATIHWNGITCLWVGALWVWGAYICQGNMTGKTERVVARKLSARLAPVIAGALRIQAIGGAISE